MALNVLIVDDSETARAVVAKTLALTGLDLGEVQQAGNGQDALGIMKTSWIDLIICDINMPVMDGCEMLQRMKQDPVLQSIPVIVVSSESSAARVEQLKSLGVRVCVRKPFSPEQVKTVIDRVLGPLAPSTDQDCREEADGQL